MDIATLKKRLAKLTEQSEKLAEVRFNLPTGASRARVTTANAKWACVAEERDRIAGLIAKAEGR